MRPGSGTCNDRAAPLWGGVCSTRPSAWSPAGAFDSIRAEGILEFVFDQLCDEYVPFVVIVFVCAAKPKLEIADSYVGRNLFAFFEVVQSVVEL